MADASGYALEDTPYASGHAGYKDWFILDYDRPGYTIECGLGEIPCPGPTSAPYIPPCAPPSPPPCRLLTYFQVGI